MNTFSKTLVGSLLALSLGNAFATSFVQPTVAEGGSDRLIEKRVAEGGSDRLIEKQVAEGGVDGLIAKRVIEGSQDRLVYTPIHRVTQKGGSEGTREKTRKQS